MTYRWFARLLPVMGLAVPLVLGAPQAAAQDQPEQTTAEQQEAVKQAEKEGVVRLADEVTVTGSLIPREDLSSLSPVTLVDPDEITYQGTGRIEELIQSLPQAFTGQNQTISNGSSGTATVDLRNVGSVRTLALLNGRRMASGDALRSVGASDLNFIPTALVKRVDVLTGGASTAYGADAVAGVVNFILDTEFEGVRGEVTWNGYQHNNRNDFARQINAAQGYTVPEGNTFNNGGYNFNLAVGGKLADGKGHASAFIDYRDIKPIWKDQRDYTNCSVENLADDGAQCAGSSTWQYGRFYSNFGDFVLDPRTNNTNTFRDRVGSDVFNYATYNFMQRNDVQWRGGGFARYTLSEHFEPYAEVMVMDNESDAQIAPSGNFFSTTSVNCDNPMLSEQQRVSICGDQTTGDADLFIARRNIEGGARTDLLKHTNWRLVGGVRGDINDYWSYDVYGLNASVTAPESYANDLSKLRMQDALTVVGDRNDPSTWQCRSGNAGCVPWNLFTNSGTLGVVGSPDQGVTQDALDYIYINLIYNSGTNTKVLNGTLTGDLESAGIKFPSASEAVQVALGGEYRKERLFFAPDETYANDLASGQGGASPAVDGDYSISEGFAEALVPLVQDTSGVQDLSLDLGYRFSGYKPSGQTSRSYSSWKALMSYSPVNGLRFRGGFNRAIRAPNVQELFIPQRIGLGGSEDICSGTTPTATPEQCARTGVPLDRYGQILDNPAGQYNTREGGNAALNVEKADTITAGFVWTPSSITGLSITADFYNIEIDDTISSFGADDVIRVCATRGDPDLCNLIHRDALYTLWLTSDGYTETTNQNLGTVKARGFDLTATYPVNLGDSGFINLALVGSYMDENSLDNPLVAYDCAGYMGNQCTGNFGPPYNKWRHRVRATWNTNFDWTFTVGWRFISSVTNDDFSPDEDLRNEANQEALRLAGSDKFPAYSWFDAGVTYRFSDGFYVTGGVNNLLDKEPPLGAGLSAIDFGPGYFGTYDPLGRSLYGNLQFRF